jgi:ketosteroid isomerase-like protein
MLKNDLIREAIEKANQNLLACFGRGDARAIGNLYSNEAQLLPTGSEPIKGPSAIGDFWEAVLQMGVKEVKLQTLEVDGQGNTAIELGQYTLFAGNGQIADRGKYIVVWKQINGDWKLHWDIWNTSQPATK